MSADVDTKSDLKAFVFKSCVRMPQVGDFFKIPWDGWASVWRVYEIGESSVMLERGRMHKGVLQRITHSVMDELWIEYVQKDFIRTVSPHDE